MFISTVIFIFLASEVGLRIKGYRSLHDWIQFLNSSKDKDRYKADPMIGWVNMPGHFLKEIDKNQNKLSVLLDFPPAPEPKFSIDNQEPDNIHITVWPNGARATEKSRVNKATSVLAIGGSFTFGETISDDETFMWKLQEKFPNVQMINAAVGGYGSVRSLYLLKRLLNNRKILPSLVMYGFIEHHEMRNIADPYWMRILYLPHGRNDKDIPAAALDKNGQLIYKTTDPYPRWPLDSYSIVIEELKMLYLNIKNRDNINSRIIVTQKIIHEMKSLCEEKGIDFVTVLLAFEMNPDVDDGYTDYFKNNGINYINCLDKGGNSKQMRVPWDNHPNARMNSVWAQCIEDGLIRHSLL